MADTALKVSMLADIGDLLLKMGMAKDSVKDTTKGMESAFESAKTAFIGLIGVGSVGAFATMIKGAIDAQGALQDLATKTGASAAALDAFRVIGATSETSMDNVAAAMNKLGKNMVTGSADAAGAGVAIKALGLDFDAIKNMKPEDQMLAIAGRLNEFADGADKGATAQALFGKAGADLLPFLKDLGGEAGNVTTALTAQEIAYRATQASMADAFGDNLTNISRETSAWQRSLAEGMTPALLDASRAFLSVATESGGMRATIDTMARDGTFATWTQNTIIAITYVADAFSGVGTVVESVGLVIGAWAAGLGSAVTTAMTSFKQATDGDFTGAMATIKGGIEQQKTIASELATSLDATWGEKTLGAKLRERMAETTALGAASEATKPQLDVSAALEASKRARDADALAQKEQEKNANALAKELKTQDDKYKDLKTAIDNKITAAELELGQGSKVSTAQQLEIKYLGELESGKTKFTTAQRAEIQARIDRLKEVEAEATAAKAEKDATEANTKAYAESVSKIEKETQSIEAAITAQTTHNSTLGLTKEELQYLGIERDYEKARSLEAQANALEESGQYGAVATGLRDQATALRTLAGLKEDGIHVKAAVDAANEWKKTTDSIANGLSSALTRAVLEGKDIWLTFRNYLVNTILDGMIKNALTSVIQSALGGLTSTIGSLFSSAITNAGGSALTGGSGASSLLSSGGSSLVSNAGSLISNVGSSVLGTAGGITEAVTGYNVATGVTVGSGLSSGAGVVGTELGLLGSGGAAGGAAAGGAGAGGAAAGGLGAGALASGVAIVGAAYILSTMLQGKREAESFTDTGIGGTFISTGSGKILTGGDITDPSSMTYWSPKEGEELTYKRLIGSYSGAHNAIYSGGQLIGFEDDLSQFMKQPGEFAMGGDHPGGLRIVGETGWELEATGPSRIWNQDQIASALRSGGASDSEVVMELRAMRQQIAQLQLEARRTADATNGNPEAPMIVEIDA